MYVLFDSLDVHRESLQLQSRRFVAPRRFVSTGAQRNPEPYQSIQGHSYLIAPAFIRSRRGVERKRVESPALHGGGKERASPGLHGGGKGRASPSPPGGGMEGLRPPLLGGGVEGLRPPFTEVERKGFALPPWRWRGRASPSLHGGEEEGLRPPFEEVEREGFALPSKRTRKEGRSPCLHPR